MIAAVAGAAVVALYLWAVRRYALLHPARAFSAARIVPFCLGVVVAVATVSAPVDVLTDRSFTAHMLQHVVLMLVVPPLLLLGAPLQLIVGATPTKAARKITAFANSQAAHALFSPLTGWLLLVFTLWGTHFSPIYEIALVNPAVHVAEHALFLTAAMLFWMPVVQVGYTPRPLAYPARMLYLFLALPQGAFLGLAIYAARHVLYAHYVMAEGASAALADQQNGGAVMWIAGGFFIFIAFMSTVAAWAASERREAPA